MDLTPELTDEIAMIAEAAYRAGQEEAFRLVIAYRYVGSDGKEIILDPAEVTIVRREA